MVPPMGSFPELSLLKLEPPCFLDVFHSFLYYLVISQQIATAERQARSSNPTWLRELLGMIEDARNLRNNGGEDGENVEEEDNDDQEGGEVVEEEEDV